MDDRDLTRFAILEGGILPRLMSSTHFRAGALSRSAAGFF